MTTTSTPSISGHRCAACGSPLAEDQRYCLACGEPRPAARRPLPAALRGAPAAAPERVAAAAPARPSPPGLTTGLAALACLLLAIGVGVLIGRGGRQQAASAPITISGAAAGAPASSTAATAAPATFTSDWPAGRNGWTIALQTLPKAGTDAAAVAAAKTAATAKGASKVGALDTGEYPSLTAGSYLVYSGLYSTRDLAGGALKPLKSSFADATIVQVSASASTPQAARTKAAPKSSEPAAKTSGSKDTTKAFEQSKKAPKTVGTGGKPPPKDNKPAAGGGGFDDIG